MATVVLNVRLITQVQQITTPVAMVHAIVLVPRHVRDRLAQRTRPVPTAVHQPVAHNITVVRAVHRLQHVPSAYRVIPVITKAAIRVNCAKVDIIVVIAPVIHVRRHRHLNFIRIMVRPCYAVQRGPVQQPSVIWIALWLIIGHLNFNTRVFIGHLASVTMTVQPRFIIIVKTTNIFLNVMRGII